MPCFLGSVFLVNDHGKGTFSVIELVLFSAENLIDNLRKSKVYLVYINH